MTLPTAEAKRDFSTTSLESAAPRARALRRLRQHIELGHIRSGDPLPPERVLCTTLEVSRGTLRRVLEALEKEGLLLPTDGGKTRIVSDLPGKGSSLKPQGDVIAIISPDTRVAMEGHHQSGWAEFIALGALREVQRMGMNSISLGGGRLTEKDLDWILQWRPYGLVIPELALSEDPQGQMIRRLIQAGIRTVVYSGADELATTDRVSSDHEKGGYDVARWFLARGRKRIVLAWNKQENSSYWHAARRRGYEKAMQEAGLQPLENIEFLRYDFGDETQKGLEARAHYFAGYLAKPLSDDPPIDAIMAETDGLLPALALACRILGRVPNQDVYLAGYDNYWQDSHEQAMSPFAPMITVDKQNWAIGQQLVKLLVDRIEGKLPPEPQWHLVPPKLIEIAQS